MESWQGAGRRLRLALGRARTGRTTVDDEGPIAVTDEIAVADEPGPALTDAGVAAGAPGPRGSGGTVPPGG